MEKEKTTSCSFTCDGYYKMLTQERLYDPAKFPELLLAEYHLGFLFRDLQLEFAQQIQNNPNLLKQAATGSGKTMAIMPMLALMLPNGSNLVTLKFLNPLLPTSLNHLGDVLEKFMRRKIVHFTYNSDCPVEEGKQSAFKGMYEKLVRATLSKSIVVTDLASFVHLDEKLIALCENKNPDQLTELEKEHIYYLCKIRELRIAREQCVFDEHDEALNINHKFLMRITDETTKPGEHIYKPVIELFNKLQEHKELGLKGNTQGDLLEEKRDAIINQFAGEYATDFANEHGFHPATVLNYFKAQDDELIAQLDALDNPAARDYAALMKDLFSSILPTALSKKGGSKYILAGDGIGVVPTELGSPGKPSERAIFDHPIVRKAYINMWNRQMGVSLPLLEKYLSEEYNSASRELAQAHANKNEDITSMKQTQAGKRFQDEFGKFGVELSALSADSKKRLLGEINKDPKLVEKFIEYTCANTEISTDVTNASAHSLASGTRLAAGVSATQGCPDGYQKTFEFTPDARKDGERIAGESLRSLKSRFVTNEPILTYTPNCQHPEEIIKELKKQDPSIGILIDGSTDTSNANAKELAKALKGDNIKKMMYWDSDGKMQYIGEKGATLDETGTLYSASQSRGADNPNSTAMKAVLLPNLTGRLEEAYQHVGRLRRRDHSAYMAVPKTWEFNLEDPNNPGNNITFKIADIQSNPAVFVKHAATKDLAKTAKDTCPKGATDWVIASEMIRTIIHNQWVVNEALAIAEELYKNRIERALDEVRESALRDLTAQAAGEKDIAKAAYNVIAYYHDTFKQKVESDPNYDENFVNPLVKKSKEVYRIPGEYYKQNKSVSKQDANTIEVLKKNRDKCVAMLESCIKRNQLTVVEITQELVPVYAPVIASMLAANHTQLGSLQILAKKIPAIKTADGLLPIFDEVKKIEESMDKDDPLLRSMQAANREAEKIKRKLNQHHHMKGAITELKGLDKKFEDDKDKLPATVREADQSGDQAEIEVNTEQEAETTLNIDIEAARPNTKPSFQDWNKPRESTFGQFSTLNSLYDDNLRYTQNYMPINRDSNSRFKSSRKAHDFLQKDLDFVLVRKDSSGNPELFLAIDDIDRLYYSGGVKELDVMGEVDREYEFEGWDKTRGVFGATPEKNYFIVDLRRRVGDDLDVCILYGNAEKADLIKAERGIVQLMVESGKVSGFTKSEKKTLENWLSKYRIDELEEFEKRYLLGRVYEHKAASKSGYPGSDLEAVINKCKAKHIGGIGR